MIKKFKIQNSKLFIIFLFIVFITSYELLVTSYESFAQDEKAYIVSPNTVLVIDVYEEPDLSVTVRVAQDGTITYPLLGNIKVAGLTKRALEEKITDLLAEDYLVSPQVSIFIKEYAKISVLGQVRNPGAYELKSGLTILDAIALAGGFSDKANAENVKLVRIKDGKKQTMEINTKEILDKGNKEKDLLLAPEDLIIIGELSEASVFISVLGQVRSPGRYNFKKGMTIVDAIALAGGLTNTAAANGTKVMRIQDGQKKTIPIALGSILQGGEKTKDLTLEPDDTIVVPESFF